MPPKIYKGFPHGTPVAQVAMINEDLLGVLKAGT
jgi:hypothetical protein